MRKFFCFICLIFLLAFSAASSEALSRQVIKFGLLTKLNSTEEQFSETWKKTFAPNNEILEVIIKFYDNLTYMQMGLNAGEINHMVLPEPVAQYVMHQTNEYEAFLVLRSQGMGLAFGFREDNKKLRDDFNNALTRLKDSWILSSIEGMYVASSGTSEPEPVKFEKFEGAETIRVAVTGDLPPVDYIAPDGTPAGFNTAVLSEVAKLLKKNIELVNIDSGARTSALASGRVDVVFWYEIEKNAETQSDIPNGVIVSQPYYEWEKFIHLKKASKKSGSYSETYSDWSFFDLFFGENYKK